MVSSINHTKDLADADEIVARIRQHASRINDSKVAMTARAKKRRRPPPCFTCGKPGYARDCPNHDTKNAKDGRDAKDAKDAKGKGKGKDDRNSENKRKPKKDRPKCGPYTGEKFLVHSIEVCKVFLSSETQSEGASSNVNCTDTNVTQRLYIQSVFDTAYNHYILAVKDVPYECTNITQDG
ncbi:hypothetical protein BD310DRAFT_910104 [Dichomitus squalens]|uniref:CCHC-type domain-containing protein n=1 Tax=Dichomitus squalens TaxID=114155 RepID=A0A4Q9PCU0_9APHY|nr:hypothetical protein BD310DRAFT_910104 [Dichomitus squalens]